MKIVALEEHFLMPTVREAWLHLDPEFRDPTTSWLRHPLMLPLDDRLMGQVCR